MILKIFSKKEDDRTRYWVSVSSKKYDYKKGKPVDGEYVNASISAKLFDDAVAVFDDECTKTKNKAIKQGLFVSDDVFLEAVEPREGEPFVRLVVMDMKPYDKEE